MVGLLAANWVVTMVSIMAGNLVVLLAAHSDDHSAGLMAEGSAVSKVLKVVEVKVFRSAEKIVSMTAADWVVMMVVCWADHLVGLQVASLVDMKALIMGTK